MPDNARRQPIPLPPQYSAEILRSDGDRMKIYTDGKKSRIEQTVGGVTTIVIWRPDIGTAYRIELETQTLYAIPITPSMEATASIEVEDDVEWEYVTTEPFEEHMVDVFDVFAPGGACRRARIYVDSETNIRWKEVTYNTLGKEVLIIATTNVEIGSPPASAFEVPAGLQERRLP